MLLLTWPLCLYWQNTVQVLLISWWPFIADLFGIDIIPFLSLLCLHSCSRCNLDIMSLTVPSLVLLCCIKKRKGTTFRISECEQQTRGLSQESPCICCVGRSQLNHSLVHSPTTWPALAAGTLISKRLVTLLVAVHVCFIFNPTSHLCPRACVRRIKCKQSESSAG